METPHILVVDDEAEQLEILTEILRYAGFEVSSARDARTALQIAERNTLSLAILDVSMPGSDGITLCRTLKSVDTTRDIPVIFYSARGDLESKETGLISGGVDYLVKPIEPRELIARVRAMLREKQLADQLRAANRHLEEMTVTDPLTGLANRRALDQAIEREMHRAERYGQPLSCLAIDVDHFKDINDQHGHAMGDAVLKRVANALRRMLRQVDIIARAGGDEFVVLLPNTSESAAARFAERVSGALLNTEGDADLGIPVQLSVGSATYPDEGISSAEALLSAADHSMYRAKRAHHAAKAAEPFAKPRT